MDGDVMNWLDNVISWFSPERAYKRQVWRDLMRSAYDAGDNGRKNSGWVPVGGTAEQINQAERDMVRARARDLERNSDIAEAIIGPFVRNVVGTGMVMQSKVLKSDNSEDEELNTEIETLWNEWCRARNCDVTGQQSFSELQQMAIRRKKIDGGIFFIKVYTSDGIVPFQLQAREVDDLDISAMSTPNTDGNRIVSGIELNKYNKPVAYHFKVYSPDGYYTGKTERISAQRVIFLWDKYRPTQIREISPIARALPRVRDINQFVEAVATKERVLACFGIAIKKRDPDNSMIGRAGKDNSSGYNQKTITPGMMLSLQPGDEVQTIAPAGQSSDAAKFITTQQRLAGAGAGLSYEAVSRDMSQVNYSSARQGLLEDIRTYKMEQDALIEHFCREVYTEFIISAVLSGALNIPDFWQNKTKYLRHVWIPAGWSWIDPQKEVKANQIAIESGQDTLARICAERGEDWREVLKQRGKEIELAKQLGIVLEVSANGKDTTEADAAVD